MTKKVANHSLHQGSENSIKTTANKNKSYLSIDPLVHKSGSRRVWHRSSRRNPCPICDRTKDGKCAYRENEIYCYVGTSNYPDRSLKIGEVFHTDWGTTGLHETTRRWALVSKSGGWSGSHYVFIPDRKKNKADYIALGAFNNSKTKKIKYRASIKLLRKVKKITKTPVVAIGGINSSNYKKLLLNKANFLAISGYIWKNKKLKPLDAIKRII